MAKEPPIRDLSEIYTNDSLEAIYPYQSDIFNSSVPVTAPKLENYNIFHTTISSYGGFVPISIDEMQTGRFIETSDDPGILNVGDSIKIGSTTYNIIEKTIPEIRPTSGKLLSFQDISTNPITIEPSTTRTYSFFISINILETQ